MTRRIRAKLSSGMTRGGVAAALSVVLAARIGSARLSDNSFLTHLTTGRLIVAGHFPSGDPYSFTAFGHPWVIQSWFASLLYGLADKFGGGTGLRVLIMVVTIALALVLWRLSRSAKTIVSRLVAVIPAFLVGTVTWGPRPLLFGLLAFALTFLILVEERDPRWLVPIMWVWVNTHGSFPMALLLILAMGVGAKLDGENITHLVRALKWCVIGILVGGINPVGPRILWFPLELLQKQSILSMMAEWKAPTFADLWQRLFLVAFLASMALIPRLRKNCRYRFVLPAIGFGAMGFMQIRNISIASIVMVVLIALELTNLGSMRSSQRRPAHTILAGCFVAAAVLVAASGLSEPAFELDPFPVAAVDWLSAHGRFGADHPLASRDIVGNYIEFRTVGRTRVFVDDRVDMFPAAVIHDEVTLLNGGPSWSRVLDRYRIDTVLWEKGTPLDVILGESHSWRRVYATPAGMHSKSGWVIYERTTRSAQ